MEYRVPELPEVETIARDLRDLGLEGRTIGCTDIRWPATIALLSPEEFAHHIQGKKILQVSRRAKFLLFLLSEGWTCLVHLRMSGRFSVSLSKNAEKHEHVRISLDDGRILVFHDTRKFGRFYLTKKPEKILDKLGPEPLDKSFDLPYFIRKIGSASRQLKALLLDQSFIAGIGNIYADEALWEAKLHPERKTESLTEREIKGLFSAIKNVLQKGIANQGTSLGSGKANFRGLHGSGQNQNDLHVYHKEDKPCPRCSKAIIRIIAASRGSHICPSCQRLTLKGAGH